MAGCCVTTNPDNGKVKSPGRKRRNIRFNHLTFRGAVESEGFSEFKMLLDIRGASGVNIEKCNFVGFRGDGVYIDAVKAPGRILHSSGITISGCLFDGVNRDNRNGISVIDCDGIAIVKCLFMNTSRPDMPGAIDFEPDYRYDIIRNIMVSGDRFENIGGGYVIAVSIPGAVGRLDHPLENVEISGNHILGDGTSGGIYVGQTQLAGGKTQPNNILISGNIVQNTKRAFMVFGVKGAVMAGNVFEDCALDPYISYSQKNINVMNMKVTGNTFKDLSVKNRVGIAVFGASGLEFRNNVFDNTHLLFRRHGGPDDYISIVNNTFKGPRTTAPVQRDIGNVTYSGHNRIAGNTFLGNDTVLLPAER